MLVYDDPPVTGRPVAPADQPAKGGYRLSLGGILGAVRRRALWILCCALLLTVLGLLVGKSLTPRYTAEAQLYIDPRDLNLVTKELTTGGQDANAYQSVVESQARLITSSNVLRRVVETTGLTRDDEFVPSAQSEGFLAKVGQVPLVGKLLGLGTAEAPDEPDREAAVAMDRLLQRLSVRRTGRTYVIDVSVWSRDAAKAARLANAVVAAYLAEDAASRTEAANRANAGLTARLGELRGAVNAAENRVQAYRAETGLVGTREALVTDQQLTQLNTQVAAARARVAEAQARVDQAQRIERAGLDAGATDDALASQAIAVLRGQYADLTRRQAELTSDLGPRHPLFASIDKQVRQLRRLIDQEVGRFVQAARTDLAKATATAASLEKSFDQAKGRTVGLAQASIRLRELEREADASRAVYKAYLTRSRETGQQAFLDMGNARVVTQATRPLIRSFPPPARVLGGLGFAAGLGLGLLLALLDDWARFGRPQPEAKRPSAPKAAPAPASPRSFRAPDLPDPPRSPEPQRPAEPVRSPEPIRSAEGGRRGRTSHNAVFSVAGAAALVEGSR